MNTSNNKRFQRTEQRLVERTLELIEQDPGRPLSVSAICDGLPINRSSFYLHHKSIQSLLDAIMECFRAELTEQSREVGNALSTEMRRCFLFAAEHRSFYRYYIKFSEDSSLSRHYLQDCFVSPLISLRDDDNLAELQRSYLEDFFQAGLNSVIERWLSTGQEDSVDEIMELFTRILYPLDKQKN